MFPKRFFERREVKDIFSYLRILSNPSDRIAAQRCINTPAREIGAKCESAFFEWFDASVDYAQSEGVKPASIIDHLAYLQQDAGVAITCLNSDAPVNSEGEFAFNNIAECTMSKSFKSKVLVFANVIGNLLQEGCEKTLSQLVVSLIEKIKFQAYLVKISNGMDDTIERKENIEELIKAAAAYDLGGPALPQQIQLFVQDALLFTEDSLAQSNELALEEAPPVQISTIHAAKGLEFDNVFVCGCQDGMIPMVRFGVDSEEGIQEEKRLFYVAITRARSRLFLSHCAQTFSWKEGFYDKKSAKPSRFLGSLRSLPEGVVQKMTFWQPPPPPSVQRF